MYPLQVLLTSCVGVAAPSRAGRSYGVNPASQLSGEAGEDILSSIKTLIRFLSVSVPCKGRDNDGIPPSPCERA